MVWLTSLPAGVLVVGGLALAWLVAIGTEYVVLRRFFATDLGAGDQAPPAAEPPEVPVFALVTVACTLAGFVLASAAGLSPAWAAFDASGTSNRTPRTLGQFRRLPSAAPRTGA